MINEEKSSKSSYDGMQVRQRDMASKKRPNISKCLFKSTEPNLLAAVGEESRMFYRGIGNA